MTRALATVERILEVADIPNADAIERIKVRGWDVVSQKVHGYRVNDLVIYLEIDSLLPIEDPRFESFMARGVRTDAEGRQGHVLKTAKFRGQISQGLVMPLRAFPEITPDLRIEGLDVTELLGIVVYEAPVPAHLGGQVAGARPIWIPKTDEDRIQNNPGYLYMGFDWIGTEKLDGSSLTCYIDNRAEDDRTNPTQGVTSRNWDLVEAEGNTYWQLAHKYRLHQLLRTVFPNAITAVVQGEAYGEGIQGNPLKIKGQEFAAFTVYVDGVRLARSEWPAEFLAISVPVYEDLRLPKTVAEAVAQVDGLKSLRSPSRKAEGIVWSVNLPGVGIASFKIISPSYLLKNDR